MAGRPRKRTLVRSCLLALAVAVAGMVPAAVPAAHAYAATLSNVVITAFSDPGAVGSNWPQEFDQTNASVAGSASTTGINLTVNGGPAGLWWSFVIEPPPGTSFHRGYYSNVQWADVPSRSAGYAALDIRAAGNFCGPQLTGGIDIRDLAVSGSTITRLDLLYEQRCDSQGPAPALFGEIRISEPGTGGLIVSSRSITWPARPGVAQSGIETAVPLYVRNPGTQWVHIGTASLRGFTASQFSVADNTCSGSTLGPGDSCVLFLRFTTSTRGPRPAALVLPIGTKTARIQLDATVRPGTTSLTMSSQQGDYIGQGQNYDLTPANTKFVFNTSSSGLSAAPTTFADVPWGVDMYPASGSLEVGNYPNAALYPYNGSSNGLAVSGGDRACDSITGSFTIKQANLAADNSLGHFDATFTQYCDGSPASLTGELAYDAEPVISTPGVSSLKAVPTSSGLDVTWANPTDSSYRYTLLRMEPTGSPVGVAPYAGVAEYAGTGTSTVMHGLISGQTYTIVAYAVDQYGNVSRAASYKVTY